MASAAGDPTNAAPLRNAKTGADERGSFAARVAAANASFVESLKILAQHVAGAEWRDVGGAFAFATGLPVPLFNGCIAVRDAPPEDLEEAVAWVRARAARFGVWIDEHAAPRAGAGAERAGLVRRLEPYPGMAVHPIPVAPAPSPGITVRSVAGADLAAYYAVREAAGMPPALARRFIPPSLASDPRVAVFVAEVEGEPVGNAIAIRTGAVLGVYAVGTLPAARQRGVGTAATWACLEAGRAWGCDVAVLQSSTMAMGMYRRMGFETVVPYAVYGPPRDAAPA